MASSKGTTNGRSVLASKAGMSALKRAVRKVIDKWFDDPTGKGGNLATLYYRDGMLVSFHEPFAYYYHRYFFCFSRTITPTSIDHTMVLKTKALHGAGVEHVKGGRRKRNGPVFTGDTVRRCTFISKPPPKAKFGTPEWAFEAAEIIRDRMREVRLVLNHPDASERALEERAAELQSLHQALKVLAS